DGLAYERFTDSGPVALLPLGGARAGLVLTVPSIDAARIGALDDDALLSFVHERFGWRAGRFSRPGRRKPYPLARRRAGRRPARVWALHPAAFLPFAPARFAGRAAASARPGRPKPYPLARRMAGRITAPRAVLVGNAAQTVHPLGAQGFNLGLRDALTLAELLEGAADPGSDALLAAYAARREEDRARTLAFSDGLARLSASPGPVPRLLRAAGMAAVDRSPTLQGWLVGGAMGYRGDVPRLSRGNA